jgi:hypothetical protein
MSLDDVPWPRSVSQLRSRSKIRSRGRSDTSMIRPGRRRTRGSLQVTSSGLLLEPHRLALLRCDGPERSDRVDERVEL